MFNNCCISFSFKKTTFVRFLTKIQKMKKILALWTLAAMLSCKEETPKEYVTLQGKVSNFKSNTLTIMGRDFKKEITLNEDGSFKDTLNVVDGFHGFNDGNLQSFMYLKNRYDLELQFDADAFPE